MHQSKDSLSLFEETRFKIKDKDFMNFNISSYQKLILRDGYIISESKIFYLYEHQPYDRGIMDMEELQEMPDVDGEPDHFTKKYASGPH